jgi:E3 ubiquitin-protein ligase AMFR
MDNPSTSTTMRSVGLTGVQIMMRQLASVSDNYGQCDPPWNLWPEPVTGSSLVPSSSSESNSSPAIGLWHRGTPGSVNNGTMAELLAMLDRVREVLPHIPDQLIMEVHLYFAQQEVILETTGKLCTDMSF